MHGVLAIEVDIFKPILDSRGRRAESKELRIWKQVIPEITMPSTESRAFTSKECRAGYRLWSQSIKLTIFFSINMETEIIHLVASLPPE
jgi:hypothetical protein